MAKFHGIIGYSEPVETRPGVWTEQIVEKTHSGDLLRNTGNWNTNPDSTNDNLKLSNQVSIVANPYAINHVHQIKYVEFMGAKWKVSSANVQYPRIILTLGGVYNGK